MKSVTSLVNITLLPPSQVVGAGSVCPTLSVGAHVDLWLVLPQRILHCDGLPVYHLQHSARDVHLHLPLPPPEKSKISSSVTLLKLLLIN